MGSARRAFFYKWRRMSEILNMARLVGAEWGISANDIGVAFFLRQASRARLRYRGLQEPVRRSGMKASCNLIDSLIGRPLA